MRIILAAMALITGSAAAHAQSAPQSAADNASALACLQRSGFKDALVAPETLRSGNHLGVDVRLVVGTTAQGEQKMKLCLVDRKHKHVELLDAAPWTSRDRMWVKPKK